MSAGIHLQPTAPLAARVLLPGDPGRALLLAQTLLEEPKMFNHNRGLWGYTGTASDGDQLTIQSTGMGGPSAAIVISELADLGARTLLRVGTCGALDPGLSFGDLVVATEAISADGTSRALVDTERVVPTRPIVDALSAAADGHGRAGTVASLDLFYGERELRFVEEGALAVEMETATLFALGQARDGLQVGSLLIVSDLLRPTRRRISPEQLREAEQRAGEVALDAITRASRTPAEPHHVRRD